VIIARPAGAGLAILLLALESLEIRECSGVDIVDRHDGCGVKYRLFDDERKQGGALKVCKLFPLSGKYPTAQTVVTYTPRQGMSLSSVTVRK
jgi:hypothetical protein